jgi:hypothetical protein
LERSGNSDRIPDVNAVRIVLLAMLFAALPLRGYAGVMMTLCESSHGGAVAAEEHTHEHGDSRHHHDDSGGGGTEPSHAASACSVCASCCLGAGLAPQSERSVTFQSPDAPRIPFLGHRISGFVPDHLDRPPLAS